MKRLLVLFYLVLAGSALAYTNSVSFTSTLETVLNAREESGYGGPGDKFGYAVSVDGDVAVVGAPYDSPPSAYVFTRTNGNWNLQQQLLPDEGENGQFGAAVSISGDTLAIGARAYGDLGSVYVFTNGVDHWALEQKIIPSVPMAETHDYFGNAVSLLGDRMLVGAFLDDASTNEVNAGSAYVYSRTGSVWSLEQKLEPPSGSTNGWFGISLDLGADEALIGAQGNNRAYYYHLETNGWVLTQELEPWDGADSHLKFGCSVGMDGDDLVVGATDSPTNTLREGSAYTFYRAGGDWMPGQKLSANEDASDMDSFGASVSVASGVLAIGAWRDKVELSGFQVSDGAAFIFRKSAGTWVQQQKFASPGPGKEDQFGFSICLDGTTVIVGGPQTDPHGFDSGSAVIYTDAGTTWVPEEISVGDSAIGDNMGYAIDIDGDTAVVGASEDDDFGANSGSVYVFVQSNGVWSMQAKLHASDAAQEYYFGCSVSIYGDTLMVGSTGVGRDYYLNGGDGAVYVFNRSGTNWVESQKITGADAGVNQTFGNSLSMWGDRAVIGAYLADEGAPDTGAALAYVLTNGQWVLDEQLIPPGLSIYTDFGCSVSMESNSVVIGASGADSYTGCAYVFEHVGGSWGLKQQLLASDGAYYHEFGVSVALQNGVAVIGAPQGDSPGSAYVFLNENGTWTEFQKLEASDGHAYNNFGENVAIDGGRIVVAAPYDNENGDYTGGAYVFSRRTVNWRERGKLTATLPHGFDSFGASVAMSSNLVFVGVPGADVVQLSGETAPDQGEIDVFSIQEPETLVDTDGDGISDEWELRNGFDINVPYDYLVDTDGDGVSDLLELYQGTNPNDPGDGTGIYNYTVPGASNVVMTYSYSRDYIQNEIEGIPAWSVDLQNWHRSGEEVNGLAVQLDQTTAYYWNDWEFMDVDATVTTGATDHLFFTIQLIPNE